MDIIKRVSIDSTPHKIYTAVSTQQGVEGWWCKDCKVTEQIGGYTRMKFTSGKHKSEMKYMVVTKQKNKLVLMRCLDDTSRSWIDTKIVFEISGEGHPSELKFTHANFPVGYENLIESRGWDTVMESLKSFCETGKGSPLG